MYTIVSDADHLRKIIAEEVRRAVSETIPSILRRVVRKEWLGKEELKELTGWSDRTIQHLRDTRQIPFAQHGRKILYPTEGIEQFLRAHHIKPRKA